MESTSELLRNSIYSSESWIDDRVMALDEDANLPDEELLDVVDSSLSGEVSDYEDESDMSQPFSNSSIIRGNRHGVDGDKDSFSMRSWNRFKFIPNGQFIVGSARDLVDKFTEIPIDKLLSKQKQTVSKDRLSSVDDELGLDLSSATKDADFSR